MKATTIKIENPLLDTLNSLKPKDQSLSSFVREVLEKLVLKTKMSEAANKYTAFLKANPKEQEWLEEWENAELTQSPQTNKKGKS